jgi:hypothetical protein
MSKIRSSLRKPVKMYLVETIFLLIPGKWCEVHELPQLAEVEIPCQLFKILVWRISSKKE